MATLIENLQELLEIDTLDLNTKFTDLEEWDSLSVLSVLALLDSDYNVNMTQKEIESFATIGDFVKQIEK